MRIHDVVVMTAAAASLVAGCKGVSLPGMRLGGDRVIVRSSEGLEPVGPVKLAGCQGIEVVGYTQDRPVSGLILYYMALRNNGDVERIVEVSVDRGVTVPSHAKNAVLSVRVAAKSIRSFDVSLSEAPPDAISVSRCI